MSVLIMDLFSLLPEPVRVAIRNSPFMPPPPPPHLSVIGLVRKCSIIVTPLSDSSGM